MSKDFEKVEKKVREIEGSKELQDKIKELKSLYTKLMEPVKKMKGYYEYVGNREIEFEEEGGTLDNLLSIEDTLWFDTV